MKINEHFETFCDEVWKQEGRFCNYLNQFIFLMMVITGAVIYLQDPILSLNKIHVVKQDSSQIKIVEKTVQIIPESSEKEEITSIMKEPLIPSTGNPRDVSDKNIRELIKNDKLSDYEAMFSKKK